MIKKKRKKIRKGITFINRMFLEIKIKRHPVSKPQAVSRRKKEREEGRSKEGNGWHRWVTS